MGRAVEASPGSQITANNMMEEVTHIPASNFEPFLEFLDGCLWHSSQSIRGRMITDVPL